MRVYVLSNYMCVNVYADHIASKTAAFLAAFFSLFSLFLALLAFYSSTSLSFYNFSLLFL